MDMNDELIKQEVNEDACSSDKIQDDTPVVRGEVMFVSTDSFEECQNNLDTIFTKEKLDNVSDKSDKSFSSTEERESNCNITSSEKSNEDIGSSLAHMSLSSNPEDDDEISSVDEDYLYSEDWLQKEKHIFILSESGKPIYTRYGKEDRLVTLFGLIQALVSFIADGDDVIRCISAGNRKFVFLIRSPLILLAVSHSTASVPQLLLQLMYVHGQVVSVLTASSLTHIFEKKRNYDFRNMLSGTERLLDNLITLMDSDPSFFLGAIKCLPLSTSTRDLITQTIIQSCSKIKNLVFGLIISNSRLISLVRMKEFLLHPADLHILFNLVSASESLKTSENWMPICLPKFDQKGYLYGHVSYLMDDCDACLLLLSVDREQFFTLSEARQKIVSRLRKHHCFEKIKQALASPDFTVDSVGAPELRHFIYKSRPTAQFTSAAFSPPYNLEELRRRLFGQYQLLHHRIHSLARPLKMMYVVTSSETFVGWVTKEFEFYAVLEPLASKAKAISAVNKALQWIKTEETKYFILNSPTF